MCLQVPVRRRSPSVTWIHAVSHPQHCTQKRNALQIIAADALLTLLSKEKLSMPVSFTTSNPSIHDTPLMFVDVAITEHVK